MTRTYRLIPLILSLSFVLCTSHQVNAGPWSQGAGRAYVKVGQSLYLASTAPTGLSTSPEGGSFLGYTSDIYAEIGLWRGLEVILALPYRMARQHYPDGAEFTQGSLTDATLGLQWQPQWRLPWVGAVRLTSKLPLYDPQSLRDEYGSLALLFPPAGDGQIDMTLWLSAGTSLRSVPVYFFVELGYVWRTDWAFAPAEDGRTFLDNIVYFAQVGYTFWRRSIVMLQSQGTFPLGSDNLTRGAVSLGLSVYMPFHKGWAFEAAFLPEVWAVNAARGLNFSVGLSWRGPS